jgi:site-specific DNA-methyltransferase (adenine-specific)
MEINKIYNMDCLEGMKLIPDKSIDMILCDLPYGITACKWDTVIPFEPLWGQYKRIIKEGGVIVLTASQPFTTKLIESNIDWFKYELIWDKVKPSTGLHAKQQPLRQHENILIFGKRKVKYNPQMEQAEFRVDKPRIANNGEAFGGKEVLRQHNNNGQKYPRSILRISNANQKGRLHPTQKPVELFEYLIKTYSNENDIVLDNCMGSGTTAIACINTNRNYIGFELEKEYFDIANKRIEEHITNLSSNKI